MRRGLAIALAATLATGCASAPQPGPLATELPPDGALLPSTFLQGVFLVYVDLPGMREQQAMLVDTGTDRTLFDLHTARQLGLQQEAPESVLTATGAAVQGARLSRLPWLRIGAARFRDVDVVGLDLSALREHGGLPIVGIAGCDLFRQCLLELDYLHRDVRALPIAATPTSAPLRFEQRTPWVALELADLRFSALVDTGFQQGLALPPDTALPWREPPRRDGDIAALDGKAEKQIARAAATLRLGEIEWRDPRVVLVPGTPKVGAGLLRRFRLVLDAGGGRLWLERRR